MKSHEHSQVNPITPSCRKLRWQLSDLCTTTYVTTVCRVGYPAVVYTRRHRAVKWNLMKIHTKKQVGLKMLRIFQFVKKCNKNVTSNFWCYWLGIWLNTSEIFFGKRPLHTWQVLKITGQSDHSFMPKTTLTTVGLVHYNLRNNCRVGYPAVVYIRRHRAVRWNLANLTFKSKHLKKFVRTRFKLEYSRPIIGM